MSTRRSLRSNLAALGMGAVSLTAPLAPMAAQAQTDTEIQAELPDATPAIVTAAQAFLASLSAEQQAQVLYDWDDDTQRANWSNLPEGGVQHGGLAWGDLSEAQRAALTDLLGAALSPDGVQMVLDQMAADDTLDNSGNGGTPPDGAGPDGTPPDGAGPDGSPPDGAGPGGTGGGFQFGSDYYFVSFLGTPSENDPWMLQFGGHHLAINLTVVGENVTLAPTLSGGQPLVFDVDGRAIELVQDEVTAANAFMDSLSDDQLDQAVVSSTMATLVLGPGQDGKTLAAEGLFAADLDNTQKALLVDLIVSRLDMLNAEDLADTMTPIIAELDDTAIAWFGPSDDAGTSYWRIVGPSMTLEFSPQTLGGDVTQHVHAMYRSDNDYGALWTADE